MSVCGPSPLHRVTLCVVEALVFAVRPIIRPWSLRPLAIKAGFEGGACCDHPTPFSFRHGVGNHGTSKTVENETTVTCVAGS